MTLHLHRSNDLDALVDALAALPALDPPDPFEPETIILQTRGMERWLSMRLAEKRGAFAHGRFLAFEELLQELMQALAGEALSRGFASLGESRGFALLTGAGNDQWRPGHLLWRIAEALRGAAADPTLQPLAAWLSSTRALAAEAAEQPFSDQTLQLAWRIAEVFHRYAIHRRERVDAWERGAPNPDDPAAPATSAFVQATRDPAHAWQPALWRRLALAIGAPHPGRRLSALIALLDGERGDGAEATQPAVALPPGFPRRLVLFGHHTLPPLHVQALAALGRRLPVHLFRPAVGPGMGHLKGVVKHPLRVSLGRLQSDLDGLLAEHAADAVDLPCFVSPRDDTLLGRVQGALYHGPTREDLAMTPLGQGDRSLQFHACASPLRQVEVLRDELLALFEGDRTLEPRDVIVMTPDIETYAPLIDAVFRDGDKDLPRDHPLSAGFPPIHRLHDLSLRRTNPIAESFLAILGLAGGRYPLSQVLDVLALPSVLAKAGLLEDELPRLHDLLREARIRWGRDEHHRTRFGQPATRRNTWAGGFDRLLLGHALATTGALGWEGIVPVDDVEGKDETRTLGLLVDYLERLFDELTELEAPRPVAAWRASLSRLVQNLLVSDDTSAGQAQVVQEVLGDIADRAERGGFVGALELGAMQGLLADPLAARRPSVSFLSGGLTFCTLVPMRTIPFRVVCLLGMDEGAFPRSPHGLGFDLVERDGPEPGDRSGREDDRMTFLETLLAVKSHLLVTWTGYRATDKRELDAAGPVAELMESVRRGLGVDELPAPILVSHPLQPFTPKNFRQPPLSFDLRHLRGAQRILAARRPLPPHWEGALASPLPDAVDVEQLAAAFEDPSRWFCRERLRVSLVERDVAIEDREPIDLDALERWSLRDTALRWELEGVEPERRLRALEASGVLPPGAAGRLAMAQVEDEVKAIAAEVRRLRQASGHPRAGTLDVDLALEGLRLSGQLDFVHGDCRIAFQAGKPRLKAVMGLWVRHLSLAAAMRRPCTSHLVAQGRRATFLPLAPARARALLYDLGATYLGAHRQPLPFFPATSWAWLVAHGGQPDGEVQRQVRDEWKSRGQDGDEWGDGCDPHAAMLFSGSAAPDDDFPFDDSDFRRLAEGLLGPWLSPPARSADDFAEPVLAWRDL